MSPLIHQGLGHAHTLILPSSLHVLLLHLYYIDAEYLPQLQHCLTTIRSVNKSDVTALITTFGSLAGILNASIEQLALVPGLGHKKVRQAQAKAEEMWEELAGMQRE